ncbi:MAG: type II toxin-antitoxin system prevent-host-death family antitoxin [Lysobacter sp.]
MRAPNTIEDVRKLAGADTPVHPASAVKAGWSGIVREAVRYGEVIVTNHNRPEVVVVNIAAYAELVRRAQANDPLRALQADFDRRLAVLATPEGEARLRSIAAMGIGAPAARRKAARKPSR